VAAGEELLAEIKKHLIPQYGLSVSLMLDSNGSNTTAAAAVRAASRHIDLSGATALVLGGTGPVGQRVARLLAKAGAHVRVGSRRKDRAQATCDRILAHLPRARIEAVNVSSDSDAPTALDGCSLIVAAGAAGAVLLPKKHRAGRAALRLLIDLNGVPPVGIEGVELNDKGTERDGVICYGALGVGGTKMKVHRAALQKLFESNTAVLDVEEVYALALQLP
jgi:NAD(P)-dependent dehydrogenase (short-subunit alcohol dehydrogenase family)